MLDGDRYRYESILVRQGHLCRTRLPCEARLVVGCVLWVVVLFCEATGAFII